MATYSITSTAAQDEALAWLAGEAGQTAQEYLQDRNTEMLNGYTTQHSAAHAPADPMAIGQAYLNGTPEQQQQVATILAEPPASLAMRG